MKKNKKIKLFSLCLLVLFCFFIQTIAYSAINSTMVVSGDAYARVDADVRITGFRLAYVNNATSSFEDFGKNHIITSVDLVNNSSSITYYVEITNYGSTDVGIFDITGLPSGVNYSIKDYNLHDKICDDSGKCNSFIKKTYEITLSSNSAYSGQVQLNFDFRTYHKVTYTDIPTTANYYYPSYVIDGGTLTILFKEDLSNVSILSGGVEINHYDEISYYQTITIPNVHGDIEVKKEKIVAKLVNGSINKVGSEVCIGKECFYIISNDGSTVSMFAKYNITLEENPVQSASAGLTTFSDDIYWLNNGKLKSDYSDYYVYDSNSNLYEYVENYKTYLTSPDVPIKKARLISNEEMIELGCLDVWKCENLPEWVYSNDYWSGSLYIDADLSDGFLLAMDTYGNFYESMYDCGNHGARPVIEISVDDIEFTPPAKVVSGDYDTIGSEVCISDECFYVISSTDDSVTMLAKYNLYVGREYNSDTSTWTTYEEDATGIQNSEMIGANENSYLRKGLTPFSNSYYWLNENDSLLSKYGNSFPVYIYDNDSIVYYYVENYKSYIESFGTSVIESRIISIEELQTLGCSNVDCLGAPSWVYSTSYWSGTCDSYEIVYGILYDSLIISSDAVSSTYYFGVRPVIVISKDLIDTNNNVQKTLIEFTVNGTSYYAKEGMTWEEWCESKYNTDGYAIAEGLLVIAPTGHSFDVYGNDIIESTAYSYNINEPPDY